MSVARSRPKGKAYSLCEAAKPTFRQPSFTLRWNAGLNESGAICLTPRRASGRAQAHSPGCSHRQPTVGRPTSRGRTPRGSTEVPRVAHNHVADCVAHELA